MLKSKKYKKYFRVIGLVLLIYILYNIDWVQFFVALKDINLFYFFFAVLLIIPLILLLTLSWKILVDSVGIKISFKALSLIFMKGLFLGIITPAKLGEFYKAKYLSDSANCPLNFSLYTSVLNRLIDLIILIFISAFGVLPLFFIFEINIFGWLGILLFAIIIVGIYFLIKKKYTKKLLAVFLKVFIPGIFKTKTENFLGIFYQEARKIKKNAIALAIITQLLSYIVSISACYLIALSLGLFIPFWYLFLINAFISLLVVLPISILGIGTREAGYIFFLAFVGISSNVAVLFSLLILVWSVLRAFPGAIVFLKE